MFPYVLLILSEEYRGQAMSHTGDLNVLTPEMDRLAGGEVSFSQAYANCPICTPSRASLFTGLHAHAGPIQGFLQSNPAGTPTLVNGSWSARGRWQRMAFALK
jgi:arylsulfatase A-like enzyme